MRDVLNKRFLLGLLIFISGPFSLFPSHLVGGKISYRYLGGNKYEYTLTVYRDCADQVDFVNPATVYIYDKGTSNLLYARNIALSNRNVIPPNTPNPCFVPPAGICVEIGNYIDTILLAPNLGGYTITHQNCCHNAAVLNVLIPNSTGMVTTTDIPAQINNSVKFVNFPPIYICQSDTFNYSFAATDMDGDSLVYQLGTPFKDGSVNYAGPFVPTPPPYNPLNWVSGFSATNPISNSGGISFNSSTGQLKFKPNLLGQYAIGICVLEYRNHALINTNRLELQFNIVNCYLVSSIPTATNLCEGLTINFQNHSTNANYFHWNFGDISTSADTSNSFTPTYTYPTYGTYTVTLTVKNTSYGSCVDSSKKVIKLNPLLSPTLQPTYKACFNNNIINFNVGGAYDPSASFNWNLGTQSNITSSISHSVNAHFLTPSTKTINVIVSQFGCLDTLDAVVSFSNPVASSNNSNLNCTGLNLHFGNFSTNATIFHWDFGISSSASDTSSQFSPTFNYPTYGNYTVTLIASDGNCTDTLKMPVIVQTTLALNPILTVPSECFKNNSFNFSANGVYGIGSTFNWIFSNGTPQTSTQENPTNIHFNSPGNHLITVSVSEYGCTKTRQQAVKVFPDPKATILLSDSVGCQPLNVIFKSIADSTHPATYFWNINNTSFSDTLINYTFINPGSYSYSVIVKDANNCSDTITKNNVIKVYPKPVVNSYATPQTTSILYPQVTFIDSTSSIHSTLYNFGDGSTSNITVNHHDYQSEGAFPYTLIVINNFGCTDTATGIITIYGIASNYVPNVFTPNNDGVNDLFFVKGQSIVSSSMRIFNRWGSLVHENKDALKGWNGTEDHSGAPCSSGTYFYIIEIELENIKSFTFHGTVQLFK